MTEYQYSGQRIGQILEITFTPEQILAIEAEPVPGVIIAGAGSGKTAVMTARVVFLIANKLMAPENILGLTFTNLAAGELQQRVRQALTKLGGPVTDVDGLEPTVSTYHAFASQLIGEFGLRLGIESDATVITDVRREQLAARVLRQTRLPLQESGMKFSTLIENILKLDDALADFHITPAELMKFDQQLIEDQSAVFTTIESRNILDTSARRIVTAQLVEEFRELKQLTDSVDYADMTRLSLELFFQHPELVDVMQKRFGVVLLDEYQDTSTAQRILIQTVFGGGHPVTAVGDGLQSIYTFRGANPFNIEKFTKHFPSPEGKETPIFPLPMTQRNGRHIVSLANLITTELRQPHVHPSTPEMVAPRQPRWGDGRVTVSLFNSSADEARWHLNAIEQHIADGIAPEEIAVLLRRNEDVTWFLLEAKKRGIAAQVRTKFDILSIPEIAEVVHYLRIIAEPTANSSWVRILSGPRFRIGLRDLNLIGQRALKLAGAYRAVTDSLDELLSDAVAGSDKVDVVAYGDAVDDIVANGLEGISPSALARLRTLHSEIMSLRRFTYEPLMTLVQRVMMLTGLWIESSSHADRLTRGMASHLKDFVGMVREFEDLNGNSTLFAFLRMLEDAERFDSQPSVVAPVQPGMINLMTVHSSKGLQFRVVCLPHLNQGIFPSSKGQMQWPTNVTAIPDALKKDLQHPVLTSFPIRGEKLSTQLKSAFKEAYAELDDFDERRLFYVALTRSTDVVLASAAWFIDKKNGPQNPSHFLMRLHEAAELGHARVGEWWGEPQAELLAESTEDVVYPVPLNSPSMQDIQASARRVAKLIGQPLQRPAAFDELTKNWDAAIDFIVNEAHNRESQVVHVPMPASLSVSSALRLSEDETEFIRDLLRPMPRAPQRAAARGTAFHAWAETHLRGLMGESASAVLPGMEDLDPLDVSNTEDLTKHQESFMASEWAQRPPHAVEYPFALTMGGRVLRGVIDAVYRQSDNSWLVIDWKTNARETANPLQLSLYRLAWARLQNCSEDDVRAAFFYVSTGNLVEPDSYFSLEQVAELLGETYVR